MLNISTGEVSEWLKEHAWKACVRQKCTAGSNPALSAKGNPQLLLWIFVFLEQGKLYCQCERKGKIQIFAENWISMFARFPSSGSSQIILLPLFFNHYYSLNKQPFVFLVGHLYQLYITVEFRII